MASITHHQHAVSFRERVYAVMTLRQAERFWTHVQGCVHGDTCRDCCWEWQGAKARGYGKFATSRPGQKYFWRAARIVYLFTYGEIPEGLWVLHHCDNPACCHPSHLFLGTLDDNLKDSMAKGRRPTGDTHGLRLHPESLRYGEQNPSARLTTAQVYAIRALHGKATQLMIAREFGVSRSLVGLIHTRKVWQHLPDVASDASAEESQP